MFDYTILEVCQSHQDDIRREIEKARQGTDADGISLRPDRSLPVWVSQLLHHAPFHRHDVETERHYVN